MIHFSLFIACVISIEFCLYINFLNYFSAVINIYKKSLKLVFYKRVSDNWKQLVMLNYSLNLIINTFKITFILITISTIFFIFDYLIPDFTQYVLSLDGIIESIFYGFLYIKIRQLIINNE